MMEKFLILIFIIYILILSFGYVVEYLNLRRLRKLASYMPQEFAGKIDADFLTRAREYTIENTRFGFIRSIFSNAVILLFLFTGLGIYNSWVSRLDLPFIASGVVFFIALYLADTVLSIPFSLYRTFKIEKAHGFNVMTIGLWVKDFVRSSAISAILLIIVISARLFFVETGQGLWWLWVWFFFLIFSVFMMYVSPYLIEPLFNRFDPVDNEELNESIGELVQKVGVKAGKVFKMDASKRTRHTNAYFTGIGRVKRIVLYDTLLERLDNSEILSVLAHEIGHWKKRHVLKHIIFTEAAALGALFISSKLLQGEMLNYLFNIKEGTFFTKVVILGFLGAIISFPFEPLVLYLSRRHETEADLYAYKLTGNAGALMDSLIKLTGDNLSNLHPHPLYVAFHYSHPPVIERVRRIREVSGPG